MTVKIILSIMGILIVIVNHPKVLNQFTNYYKRIEIYTPELVIYYDGIIGTCSSLPGADNTLLARAGLEGDGYVLPPKQDLPRAP